LAQAVQTVFPELYLYLGIDTFIVHVGSRRYWSDDGFQLVPIAGTDPLETEWRIGRDGQALISALHHAVGALAASGHNVIVDHLVVDDRWLGEWVTLWAGLPVLLVQVYCPLTVLDQRVAARADRPGPARGVPRWALLRGLVHPPYDLTVDTSQLTPTAAAEELHRFLARTAPTAFAALAAARGQP
jgi:chloramphenicol 3-O phosphotransferase